MAAISITYTIHLEETLAYKRMCLNRGIKKIVLVLVKLKTISNIYLEIMFTKKTD